MVVTVDRFGFAVGTLLAKTCIPTVRRHDGGECELTETPSTLTGEFTGTTENPRGKIGTLEGSSPFIVSWIESTSTAE